VSSYARASLRKRLCAFPGGFDTQQLVQKTVSVI
jgi:hypothetical protein